jgi:hypothetical protein
MTDASMIAHHVSTWLSLWQGKRGGGMPTAHGPLSRIDANAAVLIALRHLRELMRAPRLFRGSLMSGKAEVTGLAVTIGRAVEQEVLANSEKPWSAKVYFRVGMVLLNAIVDVTGRYEFVRYPLHVAAKLRVAPYVIAPRPDGEEWLLAQLMVAPPPHRSTLDFVDENT